MKMRLRQYFPACFLLMIAVLCAVLLSPALADMQKVDEHELARVNASVTGDPVDDSGQIYSRHGGYIADREEPEPDLGGLITVLSVLSPVTVKAGRGLFSDYFGFKDGTVWIWMNLGDQEVSMESRDFLWTLGSAAAKAAGREQVLGAFYLGRLNVKTNGKSSVTLHKDDGQMGLDIDVDAGIDRIGLASLSWGDADGFPPSPAGNTNKAGYVGLKDTAITDVTVSGPLTITVPTDANNKLSATKTAQIGFDKLDVDLKSLDSTVVTGDKKDFSGSQYVLGTLYMNDLSMKKMSGHLYLKDPTGTGTATNLDIAATVPSLELNTLAWGDPDGFSSHPKMGGVGLRELSIANLAIDGQATIDTKTVPDDSGMNFFPSGKVFLRLGFNKLDIGMDSLNAKLALGDSKDNLNQFLGSLYLGGLIMKMEGDVDIHTPSATTQGVVLEMNAKFSQFTLNTLSWGDADGIGPGAGTAGYMGWRNVEIGGLQLDGKVSMDVATFDSNVAPTPTSTASYMYAGASQKNMSPSFVHIGIGTGNADDAPSAANSPLAVNIGSWSHEVVRGSDRTLATGDVLRTFYMKDLKVGINGWVDIGAH